MMWLCCAGHTQLSYHKIADLATAILVEKSAIVKTESRFLNKNSYRPHVRSEAGYDIPRKAAVIKTADGTWV